MANLPLSQTVDASRSRPSWRSAALALLTSTLVQAPLGGQPPKTKHEPEPEPDPEPILIVGDIRPPRKVEHVNPVYPALARNAHIQGTVKLQAIIDASGRVSNLIVLESVAHLDRAAIAAVQQWRYEPTFLNGRAVPVILTVEVEFLLHR